MFQTKLLKNIQKKNNTCLNKLPVYLELEVNIYDIKLMNMVNQKLSVHILLL